MLVELRSSSGDTARAPAGKVPVVAHAAASRATGVASDAAPSPGPWSARRPSACTPDRSGPSGTDGAGRCRSQRALSGRPLRCCGRHRQAAHRTATTTGRPVAPRSPGPDRMSPGSLDSPATGSGDPVRHAGPRCPAERVRRPWRDRPAGRRRRSMCGLTMATAAPERATRTAPVGSGIGLRRQFQTGLTDRARTCSVVSPTTALGWPAASDATPVVRSTAGDHGHLACGCSRRVARPRRPARRALARRSQAGTDDLAVLGL